MRRLLVLMVCVVVMSGTISVAAQDTSQSIPVTGHWDESRNPELVEAGSECTVINPDGFPYQVVIRDESDTIVAVGDLIGAWGEHADHDFLVCLFDLAIPVPDRAFYTVFLDDQRLYTYAATSLPVADEDVIDLTIPDSD